MFSLKALICADAHWNLYVRLVLNKRERHQVDKLQAFAPTTHNRQLITALLCKFDVRA